MVHVKKTLVVLDTWLSRRKSITATLIMPFHHPQYRTSAIATPFPTNAKKRCACVCSIIVLLRNRFCLKWRATSIVNEFQRHRVISEHRISNVDLPLSVVPYTFGATMILIMSPKHLPHVIVNHIQVSAYYEDNEDAWLMNLKDLLQQESMGQAEESSVVKIKQNASE